MRVDFYILTDPDTIAPWITACRLLEKAYQRGNRVFVHCADKADAEQLDECLWTYKEDSFVPHHLQGEGPEPPPPIQIGWGEEPLKFNDILLNMSPIIPTFITRFRRILTIVSANDEAKTIAREHYRVYREQGFDIQTHKLAP